MPVRICVFVFPLLLSTFAGCSKTPTEPYAASQADPATTVGPPSPGDRSPTGAIVPDPDLASAEPIAAADASLNDEARQRQAGSGATEVPVADLAQPPGVVGQTADVVTPPAGEIPLKMDTSPQQRSLRQLPPDLPPLGLVKFLGDADEDMRLIHSGRSGITDQQEAREMMLHIIKMKLEASRRLMKHPEAKDTERSEGARGELQSLSHLAAYGDLNAATELEKLAEANLKSPDPSVVSDSQLVIIGFAMEALQNGRPDAVQKIMDTIKQIENSRASHDVPTMIVMGQAKQLLEQYGHDKEAKQVRDSIIDLFADSPNPDVAAMAAQQAGNVRFDGVDAILTQALDGGAISVSVWEEAVETLIEESADLQTVKYLAGCALELESQENIPLATKTYELLSRRFSDPATATGIEAQLAINANQARQKIIGEIFAPSLMGIDGAALDLADYRGKVVLMPFWAVGFPESLQMLPLLKEIRDSQPEQVEIVGVNLDVEGVQLDKFPELKELGFVSLRSETPNEGANPLAIQFGIVSMPFLAVLDQEGRVAAISFTGKNLEQTVHELFHK